MATVCPAARSASSTEETWLDTLLERSTAIGLPAPEPVDEPTTTVAALFAASSWTTGTRTWASWSALPSDGAVCGVTTTARLAGVPGWPLVLRNWDAA